MLIYCAVDLWYNISPAIVLYRIVLYFTVLYDDRGTDTLSGRSGHYGNGRTEFYDDIMEWPARLSSNTLGRNSKISQVFSSPKFNINIKKNIFLVGKLYALNICLFKELCQGSLPERGASFTHMQNFACWNFFKSWVILIIKDFMKNLEEIFNCIY